MDIVIIVPFFPPDSHIAATRWARLSRELLRRGHTIVIVATSHEGIGNPFKVRQVGETPPDIKKVLRPRWPLSMRLCHLGFLSVMASFKIPLRLSKKIIVGDWPQSIIDRSEQWLTKQVREISNRIFFPHISWRWGKTAGLEIIEFAKKENQIDVIIASFPMLGSLNAAQMAARTIGVPWVADMRDPLHNAHFLKSKRYSSRILPYEQSLLSDANMVWTINKQLGEMLATDKDVKIVSQSFIPIAALGELPTCPEVSSPVKIVYTGSIQKDCRYKDFIAATSNGKPANPDNSTVEIHYFGDQFGAIGASKEKLESTGISLIDHGFVSAEKCYSEQRNADLLLVFGWKGPGYECVYTGKVFDYLATGRPIIAISFEDSALADLIRYTGAGEVLNTPQQIVDFFEELKSQPQSLLNRLDDRRNPELVAEFSTPRIADKVEELLDKLSREYESNNYCSD